MGILEPILWFLLIAYVSETYYLAVMSLFRALRDGQVRKGSVAYWTFFLLWVGPGIALDWAVNTFVCSLVFLEPPGGWTTQPKRRWSELITHRLKRHCGKPGYRGAIATFICHKMLDKFDPRGRHC
jgi:hypothetical protein